MHIEHSTLVVELGDSNVAIAICNVKGVVYMN